MSFRLNFYNEKALWEKFMSMGRAARYNKLRMYCRDVGMVNPMTGKASHMGPIYAMWRYAFKNPEEAYSSYKMWRMEFGEFPTFEDFCMEVYEHTNCRKGEVANFKKKKEFKEKYLKEAVNG